jgi:hypothetical protein
MSEISCPVDHVKVNENKVRLIALSVLVLGLVYLLTGYWFIIAFLMFDFLMRVINKPKLSLIARLADVLIKTLRIPTKPVDRGPKRFAAGMGLAFNVLILLMIFLQLPLAAIWLTASLCVFAFLESFTGFCVGCYVYTGLQKLHVIR